MKIYQNQYTPPQMNNNLQEVNYQNELSISNEYSPTSTQSEYVQATNITDVTQTGISDTELLDLIGQMIAEKPPRRPPSALQSEMMEFFKSQGLNPRESGMGEFFRELMEVSKNGGGVSSLASSAPQILQDFANDKGVATIDLLSQMVEDMQSHRPQGPGPNHPS